MPTGDPIDVVWRRLPDGPLESLLSRLPHDERERAAAMAPQRRLAFVTARDLARGLLSERLGVTPAEVPISVVDSRPELPAASGLHLSISHSGPIAVCAVAAGAVGVDVEAPGDRPPSASLVRRVCTPEEAADVTAASDLQSAFLRLWVRKEAVAKAMGQGLDAGFAGIDVRRDRVTVGADRWRVADLDLAGLPAAVAAADGSWSVQVRQVA